MSIEGIITCRQASDYLLPGYQLLDRTGNPFQCVQCRKRLQVSPEGLHQMARHRLVLLCNTCAAAIANELAKRPNVEMDIRMMPGAVETAAAAGIDPLDFVGATRKGPPRTDTLECPMCGETYFAAEGAKIRCKCGYTIAAVKHRGASA